MSLRDLPSVVTVTANPAVDQTVMVSGFRAGEVNVAREVCATAGGKGVNVAAFLADYGISVEATGFLGRENEAIFTEFLAEKRVADRFVRLPGSTRTGTKIVDETTQTTTDLNLPGLTPETEHVEELLHMLDQLVRPGRWFVLAGSLPAEMPPDFYARLIKRITQGGGRVALDTSGEALRQGVQACPALVKPNIEELRTLVGRPLEGVDEVVEAARGLVASGIGTVVVSMGEEGAVFVEGEQALLARPPAVRVRSTVGAGDAMVAGMVAGALGGLPLPDRARLATAFSLTAVTRIGAGLHRTEVESYDCLVSLEKLEQNRSGRGRT